MTENEILEKVIELVEGETNLEVMKEMKTVLNKVFGEDFNQIVKPTPQSIRKIVDDYGSDYRFELQSNSDSVEKAKRWFERICKSAIEYQMIIYFPEVVITNNRNKHTIKELYVKIGVKSNGTLSGNLLGTRAYMTRNEAISGYAHSHLNVQFPKDIHFSGFCTGEGPINQVIMLLRNNFTIPNFMLFCLHLKNFVAWESKEGRPYLYMENIGKTGEEVSSSMPIYESTARDTGHQLVRELRRANLTSKQVYEMLEFKVNKTSIEVKPTTKFELWAVSRMRLWDLRSLLGTRSRLESFLAYRDNAGIYYAFPDNNNASSKLKYDPNKVLFQFKNKDITFKLESNEQEESKIAEAVPEKRITSYFCQEFSRILSNAAFTNVRVRSGSAGGNK